MIHLSSAFVLLQAPALNLAWPGIPPEARHKRCLPHRRRHRGTNPCPRLVGSTTAALDAAEPNALGSASGGRACCAQLRLQTGSVVERPGLASLLQATKRFVSLGHVIQARSPPQCRLATVKTPSHRKQGETTLLASWGGYGVMRQCALEA